MHDLVRAITQAIPADAAFTDADRRDAERLLEACRIALTGAFNPADISQTLGRLRYDWPVQPWLDAARQAIEAAEIDPLDRAGIRGAFHMATVILFDAHDRRILKQRHERA